MLHTKENDVTLTYLVSASVPWM